MADVLLTGFEAYGHTPINPAEQVARALGGTRINDATIVARVIPNIFFKAIEVVRAAIEEIHPDIVVMLGEYALQDQPTVPGGPVAYFSPLPIRAILEHPADIADAVFSRPQI
jgi:pyroglutamyl-peptidase